MSRVSRATPPSERGRCGTQAEITRELLAQKKVANCLQWVGWP